MVLLRILILYWQEEFLPFLYVSAEKLGEIGDLMGMRKLKQQTIYKLFEIGDEDVQGTKSCED
jgi:hypothetical protein